MLTHHLLPSLSAVRSTKIDFLQLPILQVNHLPFDSIFLDAYLELDTAYSQYAWDSPAE